MPLNRRKALAVLAGSVGLAATQGVPARADEDPPQVVGLIGASGAGLRIYLVASTAVTTLKAHLISRVDGSECAVVEEFWNPSYERLTGWWESVGEIWLPSIGAYNVDVEIWTAGGSHVYYRNVGQYDQMAQTALNGLTFTPESPTWDHRFVTVSGVVSVWDPSTLESAPLPQATMRFHVYDQNVYGKNYDLSAVTGPDGVFTVDLPIEYTSLVEIQVDPDLAHFRSSGVYILERIEPVLRATRLNLTGSSERVDQGAPVTISGRLQADESGTWQPMAGKQITLYAAGTPGMVTAYTDNQGAFSATMVLSQSAQIDVRHNVVDPYTAAAYEGIYIIVGEPTSFRSDFAVRGLVNKDGFYVVQGHVHNAISYSLVEIQRSVSPDGPWAMIDTVRFTKFDAIGSYFESTVRLQNACYIRAFVGAVAHRQTAISRSVFVVGSWRAAAEGNKAQRPPS